MQLRIEGTAVLQDIIPDTGQMELTYALIEGWIIDPDIHGLHHGPGNTVDLPNHYREIVHTDVMT